MNRHQKERLLKDAGFRKLRRSRHGWIWERVDGRRIQVTRTRHDEVQFEESLRTVLRRAAKEPA